MSLWGDIASGVGAVAGAGASILGANAASEAADKNRALSYDVYQQQRRDTAPYRKTAKLALSDLQDIYLKGTKDFTTSPGYDFRFDEGVKALDRSAAARGRLDSGPQGKALTRFGQNFATDEYNQGFNRLTSLAGLGSGAVQSTNNAGSDLVVNVGNANNNAAIARRSAYEGVGSSINQGINNYLTLAALRGDI